MSTENKPHFDPYADPLVGEEGRKACDAQIAPGYNQVVRADVDKRIEGQEVAIVSFNYLSEAKVVKGKKVHGFAKIRGCHSKDRVQAEAARIVKEQDSVNRLYLIPVGAWFPLTDNEKLVSDITEVKTDDTQFALYDEANKEKARKEREIHRELKERERELREEFSAHDRKDGLEYYTMRRVVEIHLAENVENVAKKLEEIIEKRDFVRRQLAYLEKKHPTHRDTWMDRYNEERKKSGITDYIPNSKLLAEYEKFVAEYTPTEEDNPEDETDRMKRVSDRRREQASDLSDRRREEQSAIDETPPSAAGAVKK